MRFSPLTQMADKVMWYKYIIKNVARRHNKTATFMPKPIFGDNGTGMHVHQSLWKNDQPLFPGNDYAGLSKTALYYIGGILHHAAALCAWWRPRRIPISALCRVLKRPSTWHTPAATAAPACAFRCTSRIQGKRIEVRFPDGSSNPYWPSRHAHGGADGIENKIDPGDPLDKDIYELGPEELKDVPSVPGSLEDALLGTGA